MALLRFSLPFFSCIVFPTFYGCLHPSYCTRSARGTRKEGSNIGVVKQHNVVAPFKTIYLFFGPWHVRTDKVVLSDSPMINVGTNSVCRHFTFCFVLQYSFNTPLIPINPYERPGCDSSLHVNPQLLL